MADTVSAFLLVEHGGRRSLQPPGTGRLPADPPRTAAAATPTDGSRSSLTHASTTTPVCHRRPLDRSVTALRGRRSRIEHSDSVPAVHSAAPHHGRVAGAAAPARHPGQPGGHPGRAGRRTARGRPSGGRLLGVIPPPSGSADTGVGPAPGPAARRACGGPRRARPDRRQIAQLRSRASCPGRDPAAQPSAAPAQCLRSALASHGHNSTRRPSRAPTRTPPAVLSRAPS
jgi:hypothetical protein